jgi:hypothetical protein
MHARGNFTAIEGDDPLDGAGMNRLLRDIGYFFILVLMVVGITGVIYHAIGDDGWIERFFGGLLDQSISAIVLVILGVLLVVWVGRRWLIASQANALFNDFLMYAMVALGVFFLGRLLMYGAL